MARLPIIVPIIVTADYAAKALVGSERFNFVEMLNFHDVSVVDVDPITFPDDAAFGHDDEIAAVRSATQDRYDGRSAPSRRVISVRDKLPNRKHNNFAGFAETALTLGDLTAGLRRPSLAARDWPRRYVDLEANGKAGERNIWIDAGSVGYDWSHARANCRISGDNASPRARRPR